MRIPFTVLSFSLSFVVLASCTTMSSLPASNDVVAPDSLHVLASPEPYGLRVDLIRISSSSDPNYAVRIANTPNYQGPSLHTYSPLGVALGNGLFIDTNGNFSVDLVQLYRWQPPFRIHERVHSYPAYDVVFDATGDTFRRTGGGKDLPDLQVVKQEDSLVFSGEPSALAGTLLNSNNEWTFDRQGFNLSDKIMLRQATDARVEAPRLMGTEMYRMLNSTTASLRGTLTVSQKGDLITIVSQDGLFGDGARFQFERTKDGCRFLSPNGHLTVVQSTDGVVTVSVDGKVTREYRIETN